MNILFIQTFDNVGGAALVSWNLGNMLRSRGYNVKYIVGYKKSNSPIVYELNQNKLLNWLGKITNKNIKFMYRGLYSKILANDIDSGVSKEIFNHPWYKNADIIHCHNLHGNFFKLESLIKISQEKKVVWTLHDEWTIMASGACILQNKLINGFYIRDNLKLYPAMMWDNDKYLAHKKTEIYHKSDFRVVVPSKWLEKKVRSSILKNKQLHLVPNGIDVKIYKKQNKNEVRHELNLPLNKKIITFIADGGQKNSWKGWQYFQKIIRSFDNNDGLLFLSIGGQNTKADNNLLNINYIYSPKIIAKYYSASDLVLCASLAESFCLVVVEAAACGVPIVSFPVGVVPELIDHKKNGYIAKYKDWSDLKNGIEYILSLDNKKIEKVSKNLIEKVKNDYSLSKMVERYEKLYQRL